MYKRNLIVLSLIVFTAGCSTVRPPSETSSLKIKLAQLERKVESRDDTINDLRSEVDRLSSKVDSMHSKQTSMASSATRKSSKSKTTSKSSKSTKSGSTGIVRVSVEPSKIQQALKNAGYYTGTIDGKIGSGTKTAIKTFQDEHDLKVDGIIGQQTWSELKNYLE